MEQSTTAIPDSELSIQQQLHLDLTKRARGGILIFLSIWLLTSFWFNVIEDHSVIFYLNTSILIIVALLRILHYICITKNQAYNTTRTYHCLVVLILFNALHWGLLTSWVIHASEYTALYTPYLIILSAIAMGGTSVLSISLGISICYPILTFLPSIISGLVVQADSHRLLIILAVIAVIYIFEAARASRHDYWQALYSRKESHDRALLLEKSSITEPLTGLYNRIYFNRCYSSEWQRCYKLQQPLSVIMIDLDHFKKINDTYGHFAGDECLIKVAKVLKEELKRSTDVVARYGGEEFIVLLPGIDLATSTLLAKNLVSAVSNIDIHWEKQTINITCSIGVASNQPDTTIDNQQLLVAADQAMYKAKTSGRNQYYAAEEC